MTGSELPPRDFHWVEAPGNQSPGSPNRGRRWWWVAAAIVTVLILGAVVWWRAGNHDTASVKGSAAPEEAPIGTPKDRLIGFPLNRQPVPGWQLSAAQIGLPPGVPVGRLFAAIGDKAFFGVQYCGEGITCPHPMGWVYGVDTRKGVMAFAPIALDGFYGGSDDCATNGSTTAVCVNPDCADVAFCRGRDRVWVIDLDRGAVKFAGPSQLRSRTGVGGPRLRAIGSRHGQTRLVAAEQGKGVYGVGDRGELTWFLPGSGQIDQFTDDQTADLAPLTLGMQAADPLFGQGARMFTLDGVDLTPAPPQGLNLGYAQVYFGGFAYEYRTNRDYNAGVALYDTIGHQVALIPDGSRPQPNLAMPSVLAGGGLQIYTATGKLVTRLRAFGENYRTIGTKVYIGGLDQRWQQWDLLTGQPGSTCDMNLRSYVGSDGAVIVAQDTTDTDHSAFVATDAATCRTLWQIPADGSSRIEKAGSALVQSTKDALVGFRAGD